MRIKNTATFGVFFVAIWMPAIGAFLGWGVSTGKEENRNLAPAPTYRKITHLPKQAESYLTDRLGFRQTLINMRTFVIVHTSPVYSSDYVLKGQDDWLFCNHGVSRAYYDPDNFFREQELARWQDVFAWRHNWLAERGIRYLVVIVPNKASVYPEYMLKAPAPFRSRKDQFTERLVELGVEVLDLRSGILANKGPQLLYFRRDGHWNFLGAFFGYRAVCQSLGLEALDVDDCERSRQYHENPNWARMAGLPLWGEFHNMIMPKHPAKQMARQQRGSNSRQVIMQSKSASHERILLFGDSFSERFLEFLACHFRRSVFDIDPSHPFAFDTHLITAEDPSIVIQLFVERQLSREVPPRDRRKRTKPKQELTPRQSVTDILLTSGTR